ncbi:MAG: hypothetical protein ACXVBY_13545, partial [Isosphaeraceae bacterium]
MPCRASRRPSDRGPFQLELALTQIGHGQNTGEDKAPPSQSEALKAKVGSKDVKCRTLDAGHIGLSVSSKAHKVFWPEVTQWL